MANFKNWRVAFTFIAVAFFCVYILVDGLGQKDPAMRAFTMLLGFLCGFIPAVMAILMPRYINVFLALFIYFLVLVIFLLGGLSLACSELWIRGLFQASSENYPFFTVLWYFFPPFLLSAVVVEAIRYYISYKKVSGHKLTDDDEEEAEE